MKKILLIIGVCLLLIIVAVGITVGFYLGPIVKYGIEEIGPKVTKVHVTVDNVNLYPLAGSAKVKGLMVGNPSGYQTPQAISVGNISVSMDPLSVFSNKVLIHSVWVQSPEVTFEGGLGGNNLSKIVTNATAVSQNPSASANASAGPGNRPAPKIEVDDFLISGAKVHVSLKNVSGTGMTLPLPDIHLTDLGKGTNGMTPAELTQAVLNAITTDTVKTVTANVAKLGNGVNGILGSTGVTKNVGNGINTITNTIGGMLGK
jgi:uncharacterized protein involved in outer membrane biogenesis